MKKTLIIFILILAIVCGAFAGCSSAVPPFGNKEPASFAQTQYDLAANGTSEYKIVISDSANDSEKYAAEEVQLFIKEATNAVLPIVNESALGVSNKCISIGATALRAQNQDIVNGLKDLEYGGVIIKTVGDNVFITGSASRGTLNGVYKFLEYEIGFRAYTVEVVEYDYFTTLKLLDFNYKYNPSVDKLVTNSYEINGVERVGEAARMYFSAGNGFGGEDLDGKYYEMWCHTTELILPIQTYGGQHEDWYGNGQLCFSNDEMLEQFAYVLFSAYISTTNRPYLMIGAADKKSCCTCDRCKEEGALYGGQSGIFSRFMNKLSDRIEDYLEEYKIDKEIMLVGLNYYYYESAPVVENADGTYSAIHESVIPDNEGKVKVGVCYTPIQACYMHAFGDENCKTNSGGYKDLLGWSTLTENMFMYTYGCYHTNNKSRSFPFNNWSYMADQYKLFEEIGLDYIFDESCRAGASPMADLRVYVRSRLGWNPNQDFEDVVNEFIEGYYGVGAKYYREYFDAVMAHAEYIATITGSECQGTFYEIVVQKYWPLGTLYNFQNILMSGINHIKENQLLSDAEKEIYAERLYKEWLVMKVNEYKLYSNQYSESQLLELLDIVKEAQEKYNVIL